VQPAPIREGVRRDGDKLFRERLGASASWLAGAYRGGYTIQLMMLVSDQAQASVTSSLVQDDYYQLRDQLYIIRKKTNPPTLFVFYGIFDSMEAARETRNNMPVFLRTHHPYPLLISDALKKIEN
jgi:MSHA biogenesis protein MshM